jgi:hypothetical protein
MPKLTAEDWAGRIGSYHFPSQFGPPLKSVYSSWQDPSDPLGSLLEVFKWARMAPGRGVPPSVFVAQVCLESGYGLKQDAILGVKATKADIAAGTFKRLRTREQLPKRAVEAMERDGDLIEVVRQVPGTDLYEVSCWQLFHWAPGLADDFELYFKIYERLHPDLGKWIDDPERFVRGACSGSKAYATDAAYPSKVLAIISWHGLRKMDFMVERPKGGSV